MPPAIGAAPRDLTRKQAFSNFAAVGTSGMLFPHFVHFHLIALSELRIPLLHFRRRISLDHFDVIANALPVRQRLKFASEVAVLFMCLELGFNPLEVSVQVLAFG